MKENNTVVIPFNSLRPAPSSIQLLQKALEKDVPVGVIGFPNTGKATFIQALKASRLFPNVISAPGVCFAETSLDHESARVLLRNYSSSTSVPKPETTIDAIVSRISKNNITKVYGLPYHLDNKDLLVQYARKNNYLRRGGIADTTNSARGMIQDWYMDKIPYFTTPLDAGSCKVSSEEELCLEEAKDIERIRIITYPSVGVKMDMIGLPKGYELATGEEKEDEIMSDDDDDNFIDSDFSEDEVL